MNPGDLDASGVGLEDMSCLGVSDGNNVSIPLYPTTQKISTEIFEGDRGEHELASRQSQKQLDPRTGIPEDMAADGVSDSGPGEAETEEQVNKARECSVESR